MKSVFLNGKLEAYAIKKNWVSLSIFRMERGQNVLALTHFRNRTRSSAGNKIGPADLLVF